MKAVSDCTVYVPILACVYVLAVMAYCEMYCICTVCTVVVYTICTVVVYTVCTVVMY